MTVREMMHGQVTGEVGTTALALLAMLAAIFIGIGWASRRALREAPEDLPHREELLAGTVRAPAIMLGSDLVLLAVAAWAWTTITWPVTITLVALALMLGKVGVLDQVRPWWMAGWGSFAHAWRARVAGEEVDWRGLVSEERISQDSWRRQTFRGFVAFASIAMIVVALLFVSLDREVMLKLREDALTARLESEVGGGDVERVWVRLDDGHRKWSGHLVYVTLGPRGTEEQARARLQELAAAVHDAGLAGSWRAVVRYSEEAKVEESFEVLVEGVEPAPDK